MKKTVIMLMLTSLFMGCATAPPPRIENGYYIFPKHEFSVKMSIDWKHTTKIPAWIKPFVPPDVRNKTRTMYFNNNTIGMIIISSYKSIWSYDLVTFDPEKYRKNIRDLFEKKKKNFEKKSECISYNYELISNDEFDEDAYMVNDLMKMRTITKYFVYDCCEDDTCIIQITMVSEENNLSKNKPVFNMVIKSFKNNPYYSHTIGYW